MQLHSLTRNNIDKHLQATNIYTISSLPNARDVPKTLVKNSWLIKGIEMVNSHLFLKLVLDSITEHIVVIDKAGNIQFVNKSWAAFGNNNSCAIGDNWQGINYLDECKKASAMGDEYGTKAREGIKKVIGRENPAFYFEYPCDSPTEKRWFMMRATPLQVSGEDYIVISHQNITERKLAEEEVRNLAAVDGLTGIANRRTFDTFLNDEIKRCARLKKPICLALLDLDHFKLLNDTYGHQYGDNCLIEIAALLKQFSKRPADICTRYGGEEFALVWGDTSLAKAKVLANKLLADIAKLKIANINSPTRSHVTASIGLAEITPNKSDSADSLVAKADRLLYQAKASGRNKVVCEQMLTAKERTPYHNGSTCNQIAELYLP